MSQWKGIATKLMLNNISFCLHTFEHDSSALKLKCGNKGAFGYKKMV